ncbi:hypothetical protein DFJ74DRAFT_715996 [Hyaloraphidium curvatum]|nr:hypothetical protein DFJ74DRAFT_715996 [Hyaloraphidium curvatum]
MPTPAVSGSATAPDHSQTQEADDVEEVPARSSEDGNGNGEQEDLLADEPDDAEEIDLTHARIRSFDALELGRFTQLKVGGNLHSRLCLRQNRIAKIEGLGHLVHLTELDLYDNKISEWEGLDTLVKLETLDLSFNTLRKLPEEPLPFPNLVHLYLVQNLISAIPERTFGRLSELQTLELGANRLRKIENISNLSKLETLWVGKNKIARIENLEGLSSLRILSAQSNRIRKIEGLESCQGLEEVYLSHNGIQVIENLEKNTRINTLDLSANPIPHLPSLSYLPNLTELWLSSCLLSSWPEIDTLSQLKNLRTVYLEGNPIQKGDVMYRKKVMLIVPWVTQVDAGLTRRPEEPV